MAKATAGGLCLCYVVFLGPLCAVWRRLRLDLLLCSVPPISPIAVFGSDFAFAFH